MWGLAEEACNTAVYRHMHKWLRAVSNGLVSIERELLSDGWRRRGGSYFYMLWRSASGCQPKTLVHALPRPHSLRVYDHEVLPDALSHLEGVLLPFLQLTGVATKLSSRVT